MPQQVPRRPPQHHLAHAGVPVGPHDEEIGAQIASALSTNGNGAIDLDAIDMWEYGDAEGVGA